MQRELKTHLDRPEPLNRIGLTLCGPMWRGGGRLGRTTYATPPTCQLCLKRHAPAVEEDDGRIREVTNGHKRQA